VGLREVEHLGLEAQEEEVVQDGLDADVVHPGDVFRAQAGESAEALVMAPLVVRAAVVCYAQDHELAVGTRQDAARHQGPGEAEPAAEQWAVAR
jgi:hypothetical protein